QRLRRIGKAATDRRDVAQSKYATADGEVDIQNVLFGCKSARYPQRQRLVPGLDCTRWPDDVLRLQRREQRAPVKAEAGEFLHRELDKYLLVLSAQNLDFRDIGHVQQL